MSNILLIVGASLSVLYGGGNGMSEDGRKRAGRDPGHAVNLIKPPPRAFDFALVILWRVVLALFFFSANKSMKWVALFLFY